MTDSERRLERLCRALDEMVGDIDELERLDEGDAPGCTLRMSAPAGSVATLTVARAWVQVTAHSAGEHPEAGNGHIQDTLGIDLSDGFAWDDVTCDTAEELAGLLVKHLYRRVDHVTPEPDAAA